jgi:hypothetical protein
MIAMTVPLWSLIHFSELTGCTLLPFRTTRKIAPSLGHDFDCAKPAGSTTIFRISLVSPKQLTMTGPCTSDGRMIVFVWLHPTTTRTPNSPKQQTIFFTPNIIIAPTTCPNGNRPARRATSRIPIDLILRQPAPLPQYSGVISFECRL